MPTMPLKSLFKRKRRNKTSSLRNDLGDEYNAVTVAQSLAEQKPFFDAKAESRKRFEAAKRMFGPTYTPREQEARETTPEKTTRFQPSISRGVESGRENSLHLRPIDSDEVDIDEVKAVAPEESQLTPQRYHPAPQTRSDFSGFLRENTSPHQRAAWKGSVVGFSQRSAPFGQKQSHNSFSAQSKSSSARKEDEDTAQYDDIDTKDYIIESDDESNEADESPIAGSSQDAHQSDNFIHFGDSFVTGVRQDFGVFESPIQYTNSHRVAAATNTTPSRQAAQQRREIQPTTVHSAPLASTPSMDSYLLRGTESDSVLLGEDLAPSASEDFFAGLDPEEETLPSCHMSTNNSLIDNSLIEETNASVESRQPEKRVEYAPSRFQNDFVKTVRHGWDYLEHSLSVEQDERQAGFTKTVQTVREGWDHLGHSLSAKSFDSDFDDMVMTLRQSLSNITEDLSTQIERALPSDPAVGETLASRQDDLLNTVINNMSFFTQDSTDEELEQEMFAAPIEIANDAKEVASAPKDPDEILDDMLENWSLTSDNPTCQNEEDPSELQNIGPNKEPACTNENAFIATVRQTLSYVTDDGDDNKVENEVENEEAREDQEPTNKNGFMATLRQTFSYVTDDGDNEEDGDESSMSGSYTSEPKRRHAKRHEKRRSSGIMKSWSLLSSESNDDHESRSASDTSSVGTASDDEESVVYQDELSVDYSCAPSDESDEGLSTGGLSTGQGGMLDKVLDHWGYFAAAAGLPEDLDEFDKFDEYSTNSVSESDESTVLEDKIARASKKVSPKTSPHNKASPKTRHRKKKSFKKRSQHIPKAVFGSDDDSESSVNQDLLPSTGIVVNIQLQPLITHTTEQVNAPEKTIQEDIVSQHTEKSIAEEQLEPNSASLDETTLTDSAAMSEESHGETTKKQALAVDEESESTGSEVVVGAVLVESAEVAEPGEYGKMNDEESIESIGCATATENVSVQSIQDADDASEVFDADEVSEAGMEAENKDDGESVESAGVVSESLEDLVGYFSESDYESENDSEFTGEFTDESSSTGIIKRTYSASSMKSAALGRFCQPDSKTEINTAAKVKSTKGQNGRVVDCQRSSKRSHRSRKKRTDDESDEASQPYRRRLV